MPLSLNGESVMTGSYVRLMNAPLRGPGEHCLAPIDTTLDEGTDCGEFQRKAKDA